jgi:hypothetical protein
MLHSCLVEALLRGQKKEAQHGTHECYYRCFRVAHRLDRRPLVVDKDALQSGHWFVSSSERVAEEEERVFEQAREVALLAVQAFPWAQASEWRPVIEL